MAKVARLESEVANKELKNEIWKPKRVIYDHRVIYDPFYMAAYDSLQSAF